MELRSKRAATPQKPSRLQPTEPLHMTTRAASKAASVSSNGGSSRRGSFMSNGQISPTTLNDNEVERYPKRRRISAASKSTPIGNKYASHSSSSRPSTRSMSGSNLQPIAESPLPRKKRKRSSDVTAENISVAQPLKSRNEFERALVSPPQKTQPPRKVKRSSTSSNEQAIAQSETSESNGISSTANDAQETVEAFEGALAPADEHVDEGHVSVSHVDLNGNPHEHAEDVTIVTNSGQESFDQDLSQQEDHYSDNLGQPTASQAETNESNEHMQIDDDNQQHEREEAEEEIDLESNEEADLDISQDDLRLPKSFGTETMDPTPVVSAAVSPTGSNQDSNVDQASPLKRLASAPLVDAPAASQDGDKPVKRLPGRRRAPHSIPKVEAALRRQLHLRMNYRAVAKVLKPILTELAKRSLNAMDKDLEAHKSFSEHQPVTQGLEQHLEHRLKQIQKHEELNRQRLQDTLEEQTDMRKRQFEHVARTIQEDYIVRLQHDFLCMLRKQQQEQDDDYSDDEGDDVIPALRRVTPKGGLGGILGSEYHWRSRPALETERLFNDLYGRNHIAHEHYGHDKVSAAKDSRPFTTFDPIVRDAAQASRKLKDLFIALEGASEQAAQPTPVLLPEILQPPATIPNDEALGLLLLAEASISNNAAVSAASDNVVAIKGDPSIDVPSRQEDLSVPRPSMSRAESLSTPAPSTQTPSRNLEETVSEQRPPTTAPISFSQAVLEPSTTQTAPLLPRSVQPEQQEHRSQSGLTQLPSIGQVVASQSHEPVATHAALPAPTPSKPATTDFWSNLARGSYETDAHGKVKLAPKASNQPTSNSGTPASNTSETSRPEDRSSRPSLPASSTILEPLQQRLRSTSDSFGPLLDRPGDLDAVKQKKIPPPKKSLYGPWPRSRNYNPLDRRASTTTTTTPAPQPTLPGLHPRPASGFGGPYSSSESRPSSYTPAPPPPLPGQFPPPAATQSGPYSSAPMYAAAPAPSYSYEQRGGYPATLNPYQAPTGFGGLPGAPISQSPTVPPFYAGPHTLPPPPPPPPPGAYGPPGLTSRPPATPPAYGPQYGGQPILPASHDGRYAGNGQATTGSAGPAFAQYQQHDGRRRRNQSLGHREFQHYHGPR